MQWFTQVNGHVYGPYSDGQMQGFVSEGRINSQSMISNTPGSGFFPAIGYDVFSLWSGTGQPMALASAGGQQAYSPQNYGVQAAATAPGQQTPQTIAPQPLASEVSQFVIMAEIRSESLMTFLRRLQTFGTAERLGDTVWVLKSSETTESLRNALSQTLTRQDRLFIVDSKNNKTAWFNIGADLDNRIRRLWDEQD